jgi:hypothetical protein
MQVSFSCETELTDFASEGEKKKKISGQSIVQYNVDTELLSTSSWHFDSFRNFFKKFAREI